jgi:hypothetical protein
LLQLFCLCREFERTNEEFRVDIPNFYLGLDKKMIFNTANSQPLIKKTIRNDTFIVANDRNVANKLENLNEYAY